MDILLKWLDEKEINFISKILIKIEYIATHNILNYKDLYEKEDEEQKIKYIKYIEKQSNSNYFKKMWYWLTNQYYIEKDIWPYSKALKHKDIIDCWAFIWDSSIALSDNLPNSKVFAIEPDEDNFTTLKRIINIHKLESKIHAFCFGVWDCDKIWYISSTWIWSKTLEFDPTWKQITIRSIDSVVNEFWLHPGLIKRDIEWNEYNSILWSLETIKRFQPILFISVYHNGKDLFEIKKVIDDLSLWYTIRFTRRDCMLPFADTLLVATPPQYELSTSSDSNH